MMGKAPFSWGCSVVVRFLVQELEEPTKTGIARLSFLCDKTGGKICERKKVPRNFFRSKKGQYSDQGGGVERRKAAWETES